MKTRPKKIDDSCRQQKKKYLVKQCRSLAAPMMSKKQQLGCSSGPNPLSLPRSDPQSPLLSPPTSSPTPPRLTGLCEGGADAAGDDEGPLVRQALLGYRLVHGRRQVVGHAELLQLAHRVAGDPVIVGRHQLAQRVRLDRGHRRARRGRLVPQHQVQHRLGHGVLGLLLALALPGGDELPDGGAVQEGRLVYGTLHLTEKRRRLVRGGRSRCTVVCFLMFYVVTISVNKVAIQMDLTFKRSFEYKEVKPIGHLSKNKTHLYRAYNSELIGESHELSGINSWENNLSHELK